MKDYGSISTSFYMTEKGMKELVCPFRDRGGEYPAFCVASKLARRIPLNPMNPAA